MGGGGEGGRDQYLVYLQKVVFCVNVFLKSKQPCIRKNLYLDQRYHVGLAFFHNISLQGPCRVGGGGLGGGTRSKSSSKYYLLLKYGISE